MLEYFVEQGKNEDWTKPPVKGELLFRVEEYVDKRLKTTDKSIYKPVGLNYIWRLMLVDGVVDDGIIFELKGLLISDSLKDGIFLTRPNYDRIREFGDVFGKINTDNIFRPRYSRASDFEVCQFFVAARDYFYSPDQNIRNDAFAAFDAFGEQVLYNPAYLPTTERAIKRACDWAVRVNR